MRRILLKYALIVNGTFQLVERKLTGNEKAEDVSNLASKLIRAVCVFVGFLLCYFIPFFMELVAFTAAFGCVFTQTPFPIMTNWRLMRQLRELSSKAKYNLLTKPSSGKGDDDEEREKVLKFVYQMVIVVIAMFLTFVGMIFTGYDLGQAAMANKMDKMAPFLEPTCRDTQHFPYCNSFLTTFFDWMWFEKAVHPFEPAVTA